jgi:hypothetical protein
MVAVDAWSSLPSARYPMKEDLMKNVIVFLLAGVLATGAFAATDKIDPGPQEPVTLELLDCEGATYLSCGMNASNNDPVAGGNVDIYSCTGLSYGDCGEVVYEICLGADGDLQVDMTYNHTGTNDLDLFLLGSCEENDCIDSSLGTSGQESVFGENLPAGTYWVVVDGWSGRCDGAAAHDINVICEVPCTVSSEQSTWSDVKQRYNR